MNRKKCYRWDKSRRSQRERERRLGLKALYVWHGTDTTRRHGAGNGAAGKPVTAKRVKA